MPYHSVPVPVLVPVLPFNNIFSSNPSTTEILLYREHSSNLVIVTWSVSISSATDRHPLIRDSPAKTFAFRPFPELVKWASRHDFFPRQPTKIHDSYV